MPPKMAKKKYVKKIKKKGKTKDLPDAIRMAVKAGVCTIYTRDSALRNFGHEVLKIFAGIKQSGHTKMERPF